MPLRIISYVGIPLFGSLGHAHGIMVVLKQVPLEHMKLTGSILQIFAMQAAAEIELLRADRDLKTKTAQLSSLVEHLQSGIDFVDSTGRIVRTNRKFSEIFGDSGEADSLTDSRMRRLPEGMHVFSAIRQHSWKGSTPRWQTTRLGQARS
ncbi:MAG: hypothetical protein OHK006_15870 [Thermodesulfovibrionales bacterium]